MADSHDTISSKETRPAGDRPRDLRHLPPESCPWLFWVILAGLGVVGAVVLFHYDPARTSWFPPCLFNHYTGLYCPGCGSTRALHQLLHGNLVAALDHNLLMVLTIPFVIYALLSEFLYQVRGRHLPRIFKAWWWSWVVVGIVLAWWVLRNLPYWPFNILAP